MAIVITSETKKKIYAAANALKSRGENITNEAVRDEMGGGSLSHVSPVMREWRKEQEQTASVMLEMPDSVRRSMEYLSTELWKAADQEARKRIEATQIDCDSQIAQADNERDEALNEVSRLEAENSHKVQNIEKLNNDIKSIYAENKALSKSLQTELLRLERAKVEAEAAKEARTETVIALQAANDNIQSLQGELVALAKASNKSAGNSKK